MASSTHNAPIDEPARPGTPTLAELRVLHAVVSLRTTAAASRALGISQPAISRSLASLENRLGRPLFVRRNGGLVPTEEAASLSVGAKEIVDALDRLVRGVVPGPGEGALHLITTTTLAQGYLARILPGLMRAMPDLRVQVEISNASDVLAAVADGTADAGLVDQMAPHGSLVMDVLWRNAAHVVLPQDHPLAHHSEIGPALLAGLPIIALPRRFSLRAQIERSFQAAGVVPQTIMECATSIFAAEMVRAGAGVSILNPFPLRDINPDLVFRPFVPGIGIETALVLQSAAPPSPTVRRFAEFLKQEIQQ